MQLLFESDSESRLITVKIEFFEFLVVQIDSLIF